MSKVYFGSLLSAAICKQMLQQLRPAKCKDAEHDIFHGIAFKVCFGGLANHVPHSDLLKILCARISFESSDRIRDSSSQPCDASILVAALVPSRSLLAWRIAGVKNISRRQVSKAIREETGPGFHERVEEILTESIRRSITEH